jgi:hypothetical protein
MTEVEELKAQLIAVLSLSQAVDATDNWQDRKHALEEMHAVIQEASPILLHYAADLMVSPREHPRGRSAHPPG